MKRGLRLLAYLIFLCGFALQVAAQTIDPAPSKTLRTQYNGLYELQDSYTIIYDNTEETAKLKEFQVIFYGPGRKKLFQTDTQTHPKTGRIVTYELSSPVLGFNETELSILSLHSGEIDAFPTNIGAILALNELREVPKPTPAPATPPNLSAQDKQRLADTALQISQILSGLREKSDAQSQVKASSAENAKALEQLTKDINSLSAEALQSQRLDLKAQIDALSANIAASTLSANKAATELSASESTLAALQTEAQSLQDDIQKLQRQSQDKRVEIPNLLTSLDTVETRLESLNTASGTIALPAAIKPSEIDPLETEYLALNTQFKALPEGVETPLIDAAEPRQPEQKPPNAPLNWGIILAGILGVLTLLGTAAKTRFAPKTQTRPLKSHLATHQDSGIIFQEPPLPETAAPKAGPSLETIYTIETFSSSATLSPAGQLTASGVEMLSGPFAVLRDAYLATGRIGYAQEGIPSSEDYAFGTGFLISKQHVATNRHVHGLYGHYLLNKKDPGGIEFVAEKGKADSDFVPFKSKKPLLLPGLDIAIYTLARPVTNRTPLTLKPIPTEDLHPRDVVVIGYPDTHTPEKPEILAVVEDDPVFAVKRISQGQIFRHSTDTDAIIGVETSVSVSKISKFIMPAICHNASTLGGNSGSPVLDIEDGSLVGVHFAGFKVFNQEEAANLAMTIAQLTESKKLKKIPGVTTITTSTNKFS